MCILHFADLQQIFGAVRAKKKRLFMSRYVADKWQVIVIISSMVLFRKCLGLHKLSEALHLFAFTLQETDLLELCFVRDVRTGKSARIPKVCESLVYT